MADLESAERIMTYHSRIDNTDNQKSSEFADDGAPRGNAQILPYAFCLIYARRCQDPSWQRVLRSCEALFLEAIRLSHQQRRSLPKETLLELLAFFDAQTLCRASATCRSWRNMCESDDLWGNLCRKRFFISFTTFQRKILPVSSSDDDVSPKLNWCPKDLYKLADVNLKSVLRGTSTQSRFGGFSSTTSGMPFIPISIVVR